MTRSARLALLAALALCPLSLALAQGGPPDASSEWRPKPPGGGVPGGPGSPGAPGAPEVPGPGVTCAVPVGDVVAGGAIDPGRVGFVTRWLGSGFDLITVGLRGEGSCETPPPAKGRSLVVDSSWKERESGSLLSVSQRQGGDPVANVLEIGGASFAVEGYSFSLWAQGPVPPGHSPGPLSGGEARLGGSRGPARTDAGARRVFGFSHPVGDPPPRDSAALLERAVGDLAPELVLACFFRRADGAWENLVALGVGDPRPAVPAGFFEAGFMLQFLARPAASCGKPAVDPGDGLAFWASFGDGLDGWLSLGAFAVAPGTPPWPGRLAPEGASWTARGHTFSVSGSRGAEPAGVERVRALALALDPDFARACLLRDRLLVEADLPALGLRAARAPSAYVLAWSSLRAEELTGVCPPDLAYRGGVFLEWQFSDVTGRSIVAQASRGGAAASPSPEDPKGGEGFFNWTDAQGTSYTVYGYASFGDLPSRDDLLFVARSLDPSFTGD